MSQQDTAEVSDTSTRLKYPDRYNVVFLNDDYTPMDFVISQLIDRFGMGIERATSVTMQIHENGSAVAGTYFYEIAEQKASEVITAARNQGHPLQVSLEKVK